MRKLLLLLLACICFATAAIAQKVVTGRVTDVNGNPVPNVSIVVKGTKTGVTTNLQGRFTLTVPANAKTIVVSSLNFTTKEVELDGSPTIAVVLSPAEEIKGDEIIVTGYTRRKKKDEAGAITTVKGSDISDMGNASIDKALQGAAPGVTVQAVNGIPGGNIRINIRGISSFGSGTAPLWVIDGIPFPSGSLSSFTQTNPLAFLNQNDIESIDILKDAASTAIYGASGANGVILVTTKKGRNQKTRIGFNYYAGSNTPLKYLDVLSTKDYFTYRMEAINNQNKLSGVNLTEQQLKATTLNGMEVNLLTGLTAAQVSAMSIAQLDSLAGALPNTSWQDAVFQNGLINNFELSLTGGTDKTQFYTSASYQINKSIVKDVDFKRGNIKVDVTNNINSKLKLNFNSFLSFIYQNAPFATDGSFLGNPSFSASLILPHNPVRGADGNYFGLSPSKLMGLLSHNVIAVTDYNIGYESTKTALANISLDYKILPWLTYRVYGGIDFRMVNGRLFRDPRTPDGFGVQGRGTTHSDFFTNLINNHTLNYTKSFRATHNIDGVVGYEFISRVQEGFSAQKTNYTTYQLPLLTAGGVLVSADEYRNESKKNSLFGTFNYNFKRKYSIGITARYDGSSRFGEDKRFGFFPSVKAVWNIDRESFMKLRAISTLRLRGSYGRVGNDLIGDFDALGTYASGSLYNNSPGIFPNRLASTNLTWEDVKEKNLGLDLGLFRDRITVSVDIYDKQTFNILQNVNLPTYTGWTSVRLNSGKLSNEGVEVQLKANIIEAKRPGAFNWSMTFNFAKNNNRVLEIINGTKTLDRNTSILIGKPLGQLLLNRYAGVNAATGRAMWYDSLGNITYIAQAKDRYYAGIGAGGLPPIQGGLGTTFTWKGFTADIFFSYQYGQWLQDGQYNFAMELIGRLNTVYENFDNRWKTPGQITHIPRPNGVAEPNGSGAASGNRLFFKSDFIRLRSVTVSYDFTPEFLSRFKIASARFYVQGGNLFTYTSFPGYDPEFVSTATGIVPQSKNITVGFNLSF
jgi:TonB-linked SusC/RagA family outer membrane protein